MTGFMASIAPYLHWLGAQFAAMAHTAGNIVSDGAEPARQTVIYLIVIVALGYVATRLIKKVSK